MEELYYGSIAERKLLADAITEKGIDTSVTDSLSTMANNVSNIKYEDIYAVGTGGSNYENTYSYTIKVAEKGYKKLRVAFVLSACSWGIQFYVYDSNGKKLKEYTGLTTSSAVISETEYIDISQYPTVKLTIHGTYNGAWNAVAAVAVL